MNYNIEILSINGRKCCLTNHYKEYMRSDLKFPVLEDDLWIVTFPKCGSTWMVEVAWLVQNNFDM
uniref:Sulfotransferase domain-containing protein n=1 Tax=Megaselia scalaris TaxID=36166 RepID=T1GYT7_MEGSC